MSPIVFDQVAAGGSSLLNSLSLVGADGIEIPLMLGDARIVTSASGLSAIASREVVIARAGRSGSRNLTRYRDDVPIVINGILYGDNGDDLWTQYDAVAGAFADAIDTDRLLKWTSGSSLALQRTVRLSSLDGPLEPGPNMITYQATLRASDPNAYSQTLKTAYAVPLGSTSGGGLVFGMTVPIRLNPAASTVAAYTNGGFVSTPPVFTLTGYLVNPIIQFEPGVVIALNGTIAASDTVVIDVGARTAIRNGTDNVRSMIDTSTSTWFDLPRGSGTLTLIASSWLTGATLQVTWRDARS